MILKAQIKPLVLDTHAWIWLVKGEKQLEKLSPFIEETKVFSRIYVSAISLWEIAMLASKKRLKITAGALHWLKRALALPGVSLAPISPEIAVESNHLPDHFHGDPADRIMVATARILDAKFVTHDKRILSYAQRGHLEALAI